MSFLTRITRVIYDATIGGTDTPFIAGELGRNQPPPFDLTDESVELTARTLLSHLEEATREERLRQSDLTGWLNITNDVLEAIPIAAAVVDTDLRIAAWNKKAQNRFPSKRQSKSRAPQLAGSTGRLIRGAMQKLNQNKSEIALPDSNKQGSHFLVRRIGKTTQSNLAIVLLAEHLDVSVSAIQSLMDLSPTEAKVARALTEGKSVNDLAEDLRVSKETVRSHLKSIFAKTATNRQPELVTRILGSVAPYLHENTSATERFSPPGKLIIGRSGRQISFTDIGSPDGRILLYFHSLRGCRTEIPFETQELQNSSLRAICVERPGHGRTEPLRNISAKAISEDVEDVLNHLKVRAPVTLLASAAGGAIAMKCHPHLEKYVEAYYLVSSSGSIEELNSDPAVSSQVILYKKLLQSGAPIVEKFWHIVERRFAGSTELHRAYFHKHSADEVDMLEKDGFWDWFNGSRSRNCEHSAWGVILDLMLAFANDPLPLERVNTPVVLWHGAKDNQISSSQSEAMHKKLPQSQLKLHPESGHYLIFQKRLELLNELASRP